MSLEAGQKKGAQKLFKYGLNSGVILGIKLSLMWILIGFLQEELAYLVVHLIIFFTAYLIHARFSFAVRVTRQNLGSYFRAVIYIKIIDYLIFAVAFRLLQIDAMISVIIATAIIFLIRFVLVKRSFERA